jgi:hypothetical protein
VNLYVQLAEADKIEISADNLYLINDKSYYLRVEDAGGGKPIVRDANGRKQLLIPIQNKISYSILF